MSTGDRFFVGLRQALWDHLEWVSPAGGHGWVWGMMGGSALKGVRTCPHWVTWQYLPHLPCGPVEQEGMAGGPCLGEMLSVGHG